MPWGAAAAAQATEYAIAERWINLARSMIEARVDPAKVPTAILDEAMVQTGRVPLRRTAGRWWRRATVAVREMEVEQGDQKDHLAISAPDGTERADVLRARASCSRPYTQPRRDGHRRDR